MQKPFISYILTRVVLICEGKSKPSDFNVIVCCNVLIHLAYLGIRDLGRLYFSFTVHKIRMCAWAKKESYCREGCNFRYALELSLRDICRDQMQSRAGTVRSGDQALISIVEMGVCSNIQDATGYSTCSLSSTSPAVLTYK